MNWIHQVRQRRIQKQHRLHDLNFLTARIVARLGHRLTNRSAITAPSSRLQDLRGRWFRDYHYTLEHDLYLQTHNSIIDIKLELRTERKSRDGKIKYAKTKPSDRVSSYAALQGKYKSASLRTMKLMYRRLIFEALQIDSAPAYDAESWISLILQHQHVDQIISGDTYPELKEGLRQQTKSGNYDYYKPHSTTRPNPNTSQKGLEPFMVDK